MPRADQGAGGGVTVPLHLIYARSRNGVIGRDNALPWRLPEDMAHFKRTTMGNPVLMGRKTWESIPSKFRPLPGRLNLVLTRQERWQADGAVRVGSVDEARAQCPSGAVLWVIGGAQIYALAEPHAGQAVVTEIDADFSGDAFAPALGAEWRELERTPNVSSTGLHYSVVKYFRDVAHFRASLTAYQASTG